MPHDLTDDAGFDAFYRVHTRTVLRWVIRLGGPLLDPEDVAQDVFQLAYRKRASFRDGPVVPWLYGLTRRVVANARRRARLRVMIGLDRIPPPVHAGPGADRQLELLERRRRVQDALETLSAKHREALVLVDLEERSAAEVAACLGISVGTVYSRLHHARKRFAAVVGPLDETLEAAELSGGVAGGAR
jgi:RNA polymerase sigma-70 factor (ECF subfamily)